MMRGGRRKGKTLGEVFFPRGAWEVTTSHSDGTHSPQPPWHPAPCLAGPEEKAKCLPGFLSLSQHTPTTTYVGDMWVLFLLSFGFVCLFGGVPLRLQSKPLQFLLCGNWFYRHELRDGCRYFLGKFSGPRIRSCLNSEFPA